MTVSNREDDGMAVARVCRRALAAVSFLMLPLFAMPAAASERVALVIGNAAYAHAPRLANPLNDAADFGAALERLGFAVSRLENADYAALRRGLLEFTRAASASEIAVVFYAGHGIEVDRRNFLVPVDARLLSDADVEFETVPLELVSRAVERARGLALVILDACRENPFAASMQRARATRAIGRGLARIEPSGETLVAYAAKEGTVAADGRGRNSPYTTALLRHIEEPGLEVGLMFRKVRDAVLAATGGAQEPFVYGSLSSEGAYFTGAPEAAPAAAAPVSPAGTVSDRLTAEQLAAERLAAERELLFWESVKDSDDPAEFEAYRSRYPGGTYEALAVNRLDRLRRAAESSADKIVAPAAQYSADAETAPAVPTDPAAAEAALHLSRADRRAVQAGLASLGFDPGPADGLFGKRTRSALSAWQAAKGEAATGWLMAAEAGVLTAAGEEALRELAEKERKEREARARAEAERQARAEAERRTRAEAERRELEERERREREARARIVREEPAYRATIIIEPGNEGNYDRALGVCRKIVADQTTAAQQAQIDSIITGVGGFGANATESPGIGAVAGAFAGLAKAITSAPQNSEEEVRRKFLNCLKDASRNDALWIVIER